jgi:chorismate mutase
MENQQNKTPKELTEFRLEIDKIDDQIINLLKDRMKIVAKVGEFKRSLNENFLIKSSREADMIKNLVIKADGALPKSTIVSIWRKIITSANMLEQEIKIALHNPSKTPDFHYLIREYYGDFMSISVQDSVTNIVAELEKKDSHIGVFALPTEGDIDNNSENWWINIAGNNSNIRVFAKIPFIEKSNNQAPKKELVVVAIKEAEKSNEDKTLLVVETSKEVSRSQIQQVLKDCDLNGKILKSTKLKQVDNIIFSLIEIDGFFIQSDPKIAEFSKSKIRPFAKVIGNYPTPIKCD